MIDLYARLKFASVRDLSISAALATAAAIVLDRTSSLGGFTGFCVGALFGLGGGLGVLAMCAWQRQRTHG